MSRVFSEQEKFRREALQQLQSRGIDPYPPEAFERTTNAKEIKEKYEEDPIAFENIRIAGRLMSRRIMGKASFAELQDQSGRIQVYFNRDEICLGEDKSLYNDVFKK